MKKELFIVLHNIRSAYNVGSIFRTADGIGVNNIYLTGYTPCPHSLRQPDSLTAVMAAGESAAGGPLGSNNKKPLYLTRARKMIAKTALGAEKNVSFEKVKNLGKLIEKLKSRKVKVVALEQDKKSVDYKNFKPSFPMALIVGNEPKGINKRILARCDEIVEIPMRGKKKSLNVSVAFGVAGYEITSKHKNTRALKH